MIAISPPNKDCDARASDLSQMFKSVKIADWPNPGNGGQHEMIIGWSRDYLDRSQPYMVVQHLHGKKELPHYHVVGVPKAGKNHLTLDTARAAEIYDEDDQVSHPSNTGPGTFDFCALGDSKRHPQRKTGKKPFQSKEKLYDADHFKYLLKPKEWNDKLGDMVIMSSFSPEELSKLARESADHHEKMKSAISRLVAQLPYNPDPEKFHLEALLAVLKDLEKEGKDPGPWVTHKLRAAMFKRDQRYQPYIARKYM